MADNAVRYDPARARRTLFAALVEARGTFGPDRPILVDGDERKLTYQDLTRGALALGHALKKMTRKGEAVGVLLPTGIGSVVSVFALSAYGRVPAMLNFTAGAHSLHAALQSAQVRSIVTAHRFIELGKFEALEADLKTAAELIYLEDVRAGLSAFDKGAAVIGSFLPRIIAANPSPDKPAIVLFTSGTEGEPKGVVLSHANILSNVEQVRAHIAFHETDVVFNPLPTFHSFGLTVGAFMPLFLGVQAVFHPSPRQPHEIVRRIYENRATILLATDTFISQYLRIAADGELASLRLAVCGAERVHDETRQLVKRKYAFELLEGYGVTEASPVISANQPGANRPGTVGHAVQGLETRLDPVEGIREGGRLMVKGPNVMLGYLDAGRPGELVPPPGGWHDTGDIVSIDEDGYLAIRGRLKRFAKIGGETISLTVVENCASALWPDHAHAAIAVGDERRGESIVLVTTNPQANRSELIAWVRNHGVPELAVPRRVIPVADVPVLGTGKTDYVGVAKIVAKTTETPLEPSARS
ncbi:MAG: acyl-[acyl-carrier-protein]-phospholipid O-acyltransferase [Alphaproteobacteria bacterium]|nr:acyl-[acyl-carrier-protein]-phospholipid O-acyltransferase [Alphaproteobacteria bacterium]